MNTDMADRAQELRMLVEEELEEDQHDVAEEEGLRNESGSEGNDVQVKEALAEITPPPGLELLSAEETLTNGVGPPPGLANSSHQL